MLRFFKKFIWLIKNQEEIEKLVNKKTKTNDKKYSLAGVPEYQKEYIKERFAKEK